VPAIELREVFNALDKLVCSLSSDYSYPTDAGRLALLVSLSCAGGASVSDSRVRRVLDGTV
jgi:hypothetical protein